MSMMAMKVNSMKIRYRAPADGEGDGVVRQSFRRVTGVDGAVEPQPPEPNQFLADGAAWTQADADRERSTAQRLRAAAGQ